MNFSAQIVLHPTLRYRPCQRYAMTLMGLQKLDERNDSRLQLALQSSPS
jgi:hypothetical protein